MASVRNEVAEILDRTTLADAISGTPASRALLGGATVEPN
jgi:hypothetical protein